MSEEVRAPLFDRLVDLEPWVPREPRPQRTLDRAALRESIRRELTMLFNTRCPLPTDRLEDRPLTVLEYGVPDFSGFSPRNVEDRRRLATLLTRAVAAYEPRLARVWVEVEATSGDDTALACTVCGELRVDGVAEPVAFPTLLAAGRRSVVDAARTVEPRAGRTR